MEPTATTAGAFPAIPFRQKLAFPLSFDRRAVCGPFRRPNTAIPPEQCQTRPEWHLSSATSEKRAEARFIAVIGVAKAGEPIALEGVEDATAGSGISVQFRRGGKPVTVSIDPSQPSVSVR